MLIAKCPYCQAEAEIPDSQMDQSEKCPSCGKRFRVGGPPPCPPINLWKLAGTCMILASIVVAIACLTAEFDPYTYWSASPEADWNSYSIGPPSRSWRIYPRANRNGWLISVVLAVGGLSILHRESFAARKPHREDQVQRPS